MTTDFGTDMRALATEMLAEFGIPASVTITEGTAGIDANGSPVFPTEETYPVTSTPLLNAEDVIDPVKLQQLGPGRHRVVFIAADGLAFTPQAGMFITVSSQTFTVKTATSYDGDERPAAWLLELEG